MPGHCTRTLTFRSVLEFREFPLAKTFSFVDISVPRFGNGFLSTETEKEQPSRKLPHLANTLSSTGSHRNCWFSQLLTWRYKYPAVRPFVVQY